MTVSSELSSAAWAAGLPQPLRGELATLEEAYFRHVDAGDVDCTITGITQIFRRHLELATERPRGKALMRVHHPDDGAGVGVAVQLVTDDMPLLVESITAALNRAQVSVTEVIHPIFEVIRDAEGKLVSAAPHEVDGNGAVGLAESWMHLQLHPSTSRAALDELTATLPKVIADVRQVIDDTEDMVRVQSGLADRLDRAAGRSPAPFPAADLGACADLLRWLADGNFTLLGYARYRRDTVSGHTVSSAVDASSLGVLRPGIGTDFQVPINGGDRPLLLLTQGLVRATVHRSVYPYFIGVADVDEAGVVAGVHLFIGVFTVSAVHENVLDIPVINRRVRSAIEAAGFDLESFSGQAMLEVIESFPRTELFSADTETLRRTAVAVLGVGLRRQVRLFLRSDSYGRFVACMVYLPRDRYTTAVRLEMQDILVRELGGTDIDYSARVSESELASVYFTVMLSTEPHAPIPDTSEENRLRIQALLDAASHSWDDRIEGEAATSAEHDPAAVARAAETFPEGYKEDFTPARGLDDLGRLARLPEGGIGQLLYRTADSAPGTWRFSLYIAGSGVSLSQVLPVLQSLGVEVVDERPYRLEHAAERWIYDFGLQARPDLLRNPLVAELDAGLLTPSTEADALRSRVTDAVEAVWYDRAEADGLNELVLRAGLGWREVTILRAYAKYLQQAGFPYSQANIARVLLAHPEVARQFVALFAARFDPDTVSAETAAELETRVRAGIDEVVSMDADRILRAMLGLVKATLRTNYYVLDDDGRPRDYLSLKVEPREIAELPKPRPQFEIFVYSPRVEGVHLRFGSVARGGLRWSDRLEDFRTEILGLVKAQAVKNAVIVPVGAKGGFVVKRPPAATGDPAVDRQASIAEGTACYRTFISGLLDVTDNVDLATGAVLPPERVVRRDGDDTYLVRRRIPRGQLRPARPRRFDPGHRR
ncbi:NAD-glutamate dehydrogenase domain-containing protein, partial [Nocardia sp. NPDC004415]